MRSSNKRHYCRPLLRLIRQHSYVRMSFLAGSGISVEAGLPSAFGIGSFLADFFATSSKASWELKQHLTPVGNKLGIRVAIRFERLLQIVRDTVDPELAILRCLDQAKTPATLHEFLATMIALGSPVFTPNFDALIERAYFKKWPTSPLCLVDRERCRGRSHSPSFSAVWKSKIRTSLTKPMLFKLHGSLHGITYSACGLRRIGKWQPQTVGATLDSIGRESMSARLEYYKEKVLARELSGRLLIILGYSGLDDFDIVPTLERILKKGGLSGLVWIFHDTSGKIRIQRWLAQGSSSVGLPKELTAAIHTSGMKAYVVRGNTAAIISCLFPALLPASAVGRLAVRFNPNFVMTRKPYRAISTSDRRFAAGRLCEAAGNFHRADALYRQAIKNSGSCVTRAARRVKGLALARRGYIRWLRGDNRRALTYLHQALALTKQSRDPLAVASTTNQIGLVLMNRGNLSDALKQFRSALKLFRKVRNFTSVAKALANIGLVFRRQGNYKRAKSYSYKALKISTGIRDREGMARDLGNLANGHFGQGLFKLALRDAKRAFNLAEQVGQKQIMAVQAGNIGVYLRRMGRWSEALQSLGNARKLNRRLGRVEGVHDAIAETGFLFRDQKRYVKASKYLTRAIFLAKKHGDLEGLAEDLDGRGDVYLASGRPSNARRDWLKSIQGFRELGNPSSARRVASKLKCIKG